MRRVAFPAGDAARVVVEPGDLFSLRGSPMEGAVPGPVECDGWAADLAIEFTAGREHGGFSNAVLVQTTRSCAAPRPRRA